MSEDSQRCATVLTKSERRVLARLVQLANGTGRISISSRHLAQEIDLSRRTVQAAIARLNDLEMLQTVPGSPIRTSEHFLPLAVLDGGE